MNNTSVAKILRQSLVTSLPSHQQEAALPMQATGGSTSLAQAVATLIDAIPVLGDSVTMGIYRSAIQNLLFAQITLQGIQSQGDDDGAFYRTTYDYTGPYSSYQQAFFGVNPTTTLANAIQSACTGLPQNWWQGCAIALLTNQMYTVIPSLPINQGSLNSDYKSYQNTFQTQVAATSYYCAFTTAFPNVVSALQTIATLNDNNAAITELQTAVEDGNFVTNLIAQCQVDGSEVAWFLWNIWMCFKALGDTSVEETISTISTSFSANGFALPSEINGTNWWNNYYSWLQPEFGIYDMSSASNLTSILPEEADTWQSGGSNSSSPASYGNGYSVGYVNWSNQANYQPPPSSCFSGNTMILMSDGSAKPASSIRVGDQLMTQYGARKVVLIETPKRAGRSLYQLNDAAIFLTAGHPVCSLQANRPARYCVDPFVLMDAVPTATASGIGVLKPRVFIAGKRRQVAMQIEVRSVKEIPCTNKNEVVFDFLLENWEKDHPVVYAGGPDEYFAMDNESSDALHDLPTSAAVVAAMESILPVVRSFTTFPAQSLMLILAGIDPVTIMNAATDTEIKPVFRVPGPDFYMQNGAWDYSASATEALLVRHLGRLLRIHTAYPTHSLVASNDYLIEVLNLFTIGEDPLPENIIIDFTIPYASVSSASITISGIDSWDYFVNKTSVLRSGPGTPQAIMGSIYHDQALWGSFVIPPLNASASSQMLRILVKANGQSLGVILFVRVSRTDGNACGELQGVLTDKLQRIALGRRMGCAVGQHVAALLRSPGLGPQTL